jgi:ABC-type antimicrobial peptide transport system permease subunit
VRSAVQKQDQDLPLFDIRTLSAAHERSFWHLAVFGTLFLTFAAFALLMASVGLYAVVAQATARRTREIGIRMALGATADGILRLVLSRGLLQLGIGLVLGLGGAFAATQLLAKTPMLVRVSAQDPFVFASVTALLIIVGLLACWIPARRAAALHPVKALRHE